MQECFAFASSLRVWGFPVILYFSLLGRGQSTGAVNSCIPVSLELGKVSLLTCQIQPLTSGLWA